MELKPVPPPSVPGNRLGAFRWRVTDAAAGGSIPPISLRRAPDALEAARADNLAKPCLAGLRAERRTDLLQQRGRHSDHHRTRVIKSADQVQIVFEAACHRLDGHPGAVRL
jgi:hypothetical protein